MSAFILILLIFIFVFVSPPIVFAGAGAESDEGVSPDRVARLRADVESARSLTYRTDLQTVIIEAEAMRGVAQRLMEREGMTAGRIAATDKVMHAFGLLGDNDDLAAIMDALLSEQIAGLYDPGDKILYVVKDALSMSGAVASLPGMKDFNMIDFVMTHEMEHALQDQHFDLTRLTGMRALNEDSAMALKSVAEGDAMAVSLNIVFKGMGVDILKAPELSETFEAMALQSGNSELGDFKDFPIVIKNQMIFPYARGIRFIAALNRAGGWDKVNTAFEKPPNSTEQIIHPEKYLDKRDNPLMVTLPDPAACAPDGAMLLDSNVLGEFHTWQLLLTLLGDEGKARAEDAAAGWGGDRFAAFEFPDGAVTLLWLAVWDTPADAREFFNAYSDGLSLHHNALAPAADAERFTWQAPCGQGVLVLSKERTAMTQCVPSERIDSCLQRMLQAAVSPMKIED